ncbi:MAG: PaaI family thioesterase [Pseudomonadota bacterium]
MADARTGEFDPRLFTETISNHGHGGHIGLEYSDHGVGWVELKLPWRDELVGDPDTGILASGPIISMMDNATSLSVWTKLGTFQPQVTLDLRVDYMRAAKPKSAVYGRGECYQVKRSIAFVRGIAHDGDPDDPVAHVAGTFINLDVSAS